MEDGTNQMNELFAKAKNAKVDYSVTKVAAAVGGTSMLTAALAVGSKSVLNITTISIMIGSVITAATALVLVANTGETEKSIITAQANTVQLDKQPIQPKTARGTVEMMHYLSPTKGINDAGTAELPLDNEPEVILVEEVKPDEPLALVAEPKLIEEISETAPQKGAVMYDSPIHSVFVNIPVDVQLVAGNEGSSMLMGDESVTTLIDIEVKNGIAYINAKDGKSHELERKLYRNDVDITLTMSELKNITLNGSGDVYAEDDIPSTSLSVTINGSGDVALRKTIPASFDLTINGSGDIVLTGAGKTAAGNISINGSGDVCTRSINAKAMLVNINGSGDATVSCDEALKVLIFGSGDVCYSGEPAVESSETGSGEVRQCNCSN